MSPEFFLLIAVCLAWNALGIGLKYTRKRKPSEDGEAPKPALTRLVVTIQYAVFFVATLATFWALFLYPYREATSFRYVGF